MVFKGCCSFFFSFWTVFLFLLNWEVSATFLERKMLAFWSFLFLGQESLQKLYWYDSVFTCSSWKLGIGSAVAEKVFIRHYMNDEYIFFKLYVLVT